MNLLNLSIGGYIVEKLLGEGGMGQVYMARNPRIDERIAIKVLHPELTNASEIRDRFVQEAIAAAKVKHPNVVEVRDVATLPDGSVYISLEYLEGMDLEKYLAQRGGRLAESDVLLIMGQVCFALHEAHLKGIVHRDLKPANVFITSDRERDTLVKLLDFGIARIKGALKQASGTMTGERQVLGTPTYMAPEQVTSPRSVDQRADIYALGGMLYQLLTGWLPFQAETVEALILAKHQQQPRPPSSLVPGLSPIWDVIVSRCLGWEPNTRYPSVHSLLMDIVDGTMTAAGPVAGVAHADEVLRLAWPKYRDAATSYDETRRSSSAVGVAPASTGGNFMTTSISGAAGERAIARSTPPPARSRLGWMLALGTVAAAGMTAGVIAVSRMGGASSADVPNTAAPAAPPRPTTHAPATLPPATEPSSPTPASVPPTTPAPESTTVRQPPSSTTSSTDSKGSATQTAAPPTTAAAPQNVKAPSAGGDTTSAPRVTTKTHSKQPHAESRPPSLPPPTEPKPDATKPRAPTPPKPIDPDGVM